MTRCPIAVLALVACAHPAPPEPPVPVDAVSFSPSGSSRSDARWWTDLGDPRLDATVEQALGDNLTVRAAWSRLRAAEEVVIQSRSPLFPWVSGYANSSVGTDDPFGGVQRVPIEVGLRASYEIDLFGRLRNQLQSDVAARESSRHDAQAAAISLSADVVSTWIAIGSLREQLRLVDEQVEANEGMSEVMQSRFLHGVVRQADALRQDRLLEQTRAERLSRQEDLEVLEHRLATLLGLPPQVTPDRPHELPTLPPLPQAGLPSELIRRRPDVRAAEEQLVAADHRVAVAVADQYPRLTLTGQVSGAPQSAAALLEGWVASLSASLVAPLFEAGRRRSEVRRTRAVLDQRVAQWGDAVLTALQEVEDALTRDRLQQQRVENLDLQVDLASRAAEDLQIQYAGGMGVAWLDVITARTTEQQLRRQQIAARERHLQVRVDLYRALAGPIPGADPSQRADATEEDSE